jgi:transcriptional regulator
MYIPAHFAVDAAAVDELLARHGAADLITLTEDGLLATMLPFVYEPTAGEHGTLYGHVARNNDQWRKPALGESLVIVRGPDAYVSPSWYAAKAEHGRVVPTWNYVTAHVYGRLVVHDDPAWVEDVVRRLTAKHEAARLASPGQRMPWSVDDAPRAFIEGQLRAIVGLELQITRIEAKAKLSQNRPVGDIAGVVSGLAARGDAGGAAAVEQANAERVLAKAKALGQAPPSVPSPAIPEPATPGPATPGPATPGPATPGPATPGPATPGPATPGPRDARHRAPPEHHHSFG